MNLERQPRGTIFALALIVAGALLFLDNLGIVPIEDIGAYWPLALVVYGLGTLWYKRNSLALIWSGSLILAGILLILGNLQILHVTVGRLWPLLLIALGASMLVDRSGWSSDLWERLHKHDLLSHEEHLKRKAERWRHKRERWAQRIAWREGTYSGSAFASNLTDSIQEKIHERINRNPWSENRLSETAVFFAAKRRVETQDFQGGELDAVFGSIELDLTGASMQLLAAPENEGLPTRRAIIDASAVFGSIEIMVPRTWRIIREGAGVFGSYEDNSIPRPEPGVEPPTLVVRGAAVFGSVEIRN